MGICQDTGSSLKVVFYFPNSLQPICAIDVSVKSLALAGHFLCATNQQRSADDEGEVT